MLQGYNHFFKAIAPKVLPYPLQGYLAHQKQPHKKQHDPLQGYLAHKKQPPP